MLSRGAILAECLVKNSTPKVNFNQNNSEKFGEKYFQIIEQRSSECTERKKCLSCVMTTSTYEYWSKVHNFAWLTLIKGYEKKCCVAKWKNSSDFNQL